MDPIRQLPQRAPALYLLAGIIPGLLLARAAPVSPWILVVALPLALFACRLAARGRSGVWLLVFALSATLGFWAYGSARLPTKPAPERLAMPPREAVLEFKIQRVMQAENRFGKSTGIARVVAASETSRLRANSRIFFRFSREDTERLDMMRGVTVEATGVLHPIAADVAPDSFEAYLQETGIHYLFSQTSGAKMTRPASTFKELCHQTNLKFQDYLRLGAPEAGHFSQIYIAMLLGQKTELTPEQKDRFKMTGTMHLFAISGLHIGVMATVIWQMLLLCRVPPRLTAFLGLPVLYFYVEVTGGAPSAIRAFLMVAFFWASMAVQRQRAPLPALAASAVLVLLIQPSQLWQMGFQLSYLVVLSIILYGLPLREKLVPLLRPGQFLPETDWSTYQKARCWFADKLLLLFIISLSAWLASAPLSAGFFGFVAPYAILVNILLVNLAALVICSGAITLTLASLGVPALASFINHAAWVGISIMDAIVRLNVTLPWATIECPQFPKLLSYSGILAYSGTILYAHYWNRALIRFLLPPLIVFATLLLGLSYR